ncbi:MAG TPA: peptidylprolyl isomerase [Thermoanaerobaculia bacterium]|nr:peptidylprolyl isomerase [Thermoanaerobaculia bacterium]HUM28589.1 peptidylprolyl isomerase [Thermoanaerobaculia bacterium]HXK66803.1 peptidylprolyl isomerase [Thermoanaerobaculia bacterium]
MSLHRNLGFTLLALLGGLLACSRAEVQNPREPCSRQGVSHILVSYGKGAKVEEARSRTREEAEILAESILNEIRKGTLPFEEGVASRSDDVESRKHQGYIGLIRKGYGIKDLEDSILPLKPGDLSNVISLPDGFHIFRIEPIEYRGYIHVLLSHVDAKNLPLGVSRTQKEALTLAEEIRQRAVNGESMDELAREFSNGMEAKRGGYLPVYLRNQLISPLDQIWDLEVGNVSPVLESPYGFHLFQRVEPLPECIGLRHVMVAYAGALMSPISVTRDRAEARDLADRLYKELTEGGADFSQIAKDYSDDRTSRRSGGDLGTISWDEVPMEVEDVGFRMEAGTLSEVVESPGGFHILLRTH